MSLVIIFVYAYTIVTGALLYIFLMGPTEFHKNGYVGKARQFIINCPQIVCGKCCTLFCGDKGFACAKRCEHYLCYERNPILQVRNLVFFYIQIVYLGLMAINIGLFFVFVYPLWPTAYVAAYHK
jgi:hypothetical protein